MQISPILRFIALLLMLFPAPFTIKAADSTDCYLRDPEGRIREHNVDFTHMLLNVKFDVHEGRVIGEVHYNFSPIQYQVDTLFLDAPGIHINKVLLNGADAKFETDSAGLIIRFDKPLDWNKSYKLDITYEATPRKGIYFIGWNVTAKNPDNDRFFTRHQIWTQGQGIDNRYWFPCYDDVDDKLLTETEITFDTAYTVISNGDLKGKKLNRDGTCTWHYAMNKPMQTYLVMIGIDKYAYHDYKSKNGITSRQYYYADHPEDATPTYRYTAEMMDFLAEQTGFAYPWLSYANVPVQDFMYGAMENTTATVYTDYLLVNERTYLERSYIATSAHELTHQWFGDCITEYSPPHHWLHESFATYYSKQFMHKIEGESQYEWTKHAEAVQAINADRNDRFPIANSHAGSARVYPKGSFVLDMLRYVVGDSVFKRTITHYLTKHAYSNVTNHDFMMAFMETAGLNLDWFFNQWVFHAGYPNYQVSYEKQAGKLAFFIKQTQRVDNLQDYFQMPVAFEAHFTDGSTTSTTAWLSHGADTVYLNAPAGKKLEYTLFDPGYNIIKTVEFNRSYDELAAQALKAPHMIDRYEALTELRTTGIEIKRTLLNQVLNKGDYSEITIEVLQQLAKDSTPATWQLFGKALQSPDVFVRRTALDNLETIPAQLVPQAEKMLADSSYVNIEIALRKLCKQFPEKSAAYLAQVKNIKGQSDNVRIAWLELSTNIPGADSAKIQPYYHELVNYAGNSYEFRTRIKAMDALSRLNYCDSQLIYNLFNAVLYTNGRLSNPAANVLRAALKTPANLQLAKQVLEVNKWTDWQHKALEGYLKN